MHAHLFLLCWWGVLSFLCALACLCVRVSNAFAQLLRVRQQLEQHEITSSSQLNLQAICRHECPAANCTCPSVFPQCAWLCVQAVQAARGDAVAGAQRVTDAEHRPVAAMLVGTLSPLCVYPCTSRLWAHAKLVCRWALSPLCVCMCACAMGLWASA